MKKLVLVPVTCLALLGASCEIPTTKQFGVLIADPTHIASDYQAGIRVAMRSQHWNDWSTAKQNSEIAIAQQYRDAGFTYGINMGLHAPPVGVAKLTDQHGNQSVQADLFFNSSVRGQAALYMADVIAKLQPSIITVGTGTTGEAQYPNVVGDKTANNWWAFGAAALATNPYPTWIPGTPATVEQVQTWWNWYRNALVDTVRWEIDTVRNTGFTGLIQVQIPGGGTKPNLQAQRLDANLASPTVNTSMNMAANFYETIPLMLAGQTNVNVVTTSIGNQTGSPIGNGCSVNDSSVQPTDSVIDTWSSSRWVAYIAHKNNLTLTGENTGWNESADISMIENQIRSCDFKGLNWAFDYQLYNGVNANIVDYQGMIARLQAP